MRVDESHAEIIVIVVDPPMNPIIYELCRNALVLKAERNNGRRTKLPKEVLYEVNVSGLIYCMESLSRHSIDVHASARRASFDDNTVRCSQ